MASNDPRIETFFAEDSPWQVVLGALRVILIDCGLTEDYKWSSPVYTVQGSNVAILWGFKDHAALGFFKGVLLRDDDRLLVAPGPNSRSARLIKFTDPAEVARLKPKLRDYIRDAAELEQAGRKVDFPKDDLPYPDELITRFQDDRALQSAFRALTPGRQRAYVLHFSQAKQPATRMARIEKCAPRILVGKGLNDRSS